LPIRKIKFPGGNLPPGRSLSPPLLRGAACDTLRRMTASERTAKAEVERNGLSASFMLFAASRDLEAHASGDRRFSAAADSIKQIEATLDQVSDDTLLKLASVNITSEGALSQLIGARLEQVGFALGLYPDAPAFFAPIEATVDKILHDARHQHLN
jgi:hypothetical protein